MTDTERLDAIGKHGLCVVRHEVLTIDGWQSTWVCQHGARTFFGDDIRQVIDAAVLDLQTAGQTPH